jgi:hypothetical protein
MMKKQVYFCIFAVFVLLILPVGSALNTSLEEQSITGHVDTSEVNGSFDPPLFTGYLLIHVYTYTAGVGFEPYEGANVTVKGFLYSYTGQTDENGDYLFNVHTNLFRPKKYFVKVSISPDDWLHTKRISFFIQPRQILYKEFLFIVL